MIQKYTISFVFVQLENLFAPLFTFLNQMNRIQKVLLHVIEPSDTILFSTGIS